MNAPVVCSYCNQPAEKTNGAVVYPHLPKLSGKVIYRCVPCAAWVGCHPGTDKPLGRLAKADLRRAKIDAHNMFDSLWKIGWMKRGEAYQFLADELGIRREHTHIGHFDVETCLKVTAIAKAKLRWFIAKNNKEQRRPHESKS